MQRAAHTVTCVVVEKSTPGPMSGQRTRRSMPCHPSAIGAHSKATSALVTGSVLILEPAALLGSLPADSVVIGVVAGPPTAAAHTARGCGGARRELPTKATGQNSFARLTATVFCDENKPATPAPQQTQKLAALFCVEYPSFFVTLSRFFRGVSEPDDSASW